MPKRNIKGFIDPISIIGVLFLIITLVVGTKVTNDRKISLNINEQAKKEEKTGNAAFDKCREESGREVCNERLGTNINWKGEDKTVYEEPAAPAPEAPAAIVPISNTLEKEEKAYECDPNDGGSCLKAVAEGKAVIKYYEDPKEKAVEAEKQTEVAVPTTVTVEPEQIGLTQSTNQTSGTTVVQQPAVTEVTTTTQVGQPCTNCHLTPTQQTVAQVINLMNKDAPTPAISEQNLSIANVLFRNQINQDNFENYVKENGVPKQSQKSKNQDAIKMIEIVGAEALIAIPLVMVGTTISAVGLPVAGLMAMNTIAAATPTISALTVGGLTIGAVDCAINGGDSKFCKTAGDLAIMGYTGAPAEFTQMFNQGAQVYTDTASVLSNIRRIPTVPNQVVPELGSGDDILNMVWDNVTQKFVMEGSTVSKAIVQQQSTLTNIENEMLFAPANQNFLSQVIPETGGGITMNQIIGPNSITNDLLNAMAPYAPIGNPIPTTLDTTSINAFKNIGQDITTTFDNLKNGFEFNGFKNDEGKFTLWPFGKVTLPKNIEPEIDLNKLEVKDVPSWENVKNKEVATVIDVENINSVPPLKGRDFTPQVKPVRELYPVEIVNNLFFSEESADSGRKLVQDYLQALKNGEDVSEYQKIAKSFLNDQEKVYSTQSQSAKSKLASWISRNYNDVDVNSLPTENIDDLALVRVMSSPDPIGVDPYGNVVIQSTFLGNPQKDAESLYRTSKHFTVNGAVAPVQTAYGRVADWSAGDVVVITPMNEFVKINGSPNTFAVQDTWWTPGTYDNLVLPKGTVLIIKDGSEALKEYANLPGVLIIKSENPYRSSRIVLEQSGYQYKAQGTEYSEPDTPEEVFLNESVFAYNIGANSGLHFDSPTMNVGNELSTRLLTDETINDMSAWSEGDLSRHQRLNTVVDLIQDGYFSSETINGLYIPPGDIPSRRELTPANFDRFTSPLTNSQIKAVEDIISNEKLTLPNYWENQGIATKYQQLIKDSFVDPTLASGLPLLKPDIFGLTNEDTNFLRQNVNELTKTTIPVSEKLVTENLGATDNTIKLNETPEQSKLTIFGFELRSPIGTDGKLQLPFEQTVGPNADYLTKYSEIVPAPNTTVKDKELLGIYLQEDLANPYIPVDYSKTVNDLIENTNGPLIEIGGPSLRGFKQIDLNTLEKPIVVTNINNGLATYNENSGSFLGYSGKVDRILDATHMNLPDESVGSFVGASLQEEVIPKFLEESYRTLEPGGIIVLDNTASEWVLSKANDLGFRVIEESANPIGSINLTLQKPPFSMPEVSVGKNAAETTQLAERPSLLGFGWNGFRNPEGQFQFPVGRVPSVLEIPATQVVSNLPDIPESTAKFIDTPWQSIRRTESEIIADNAKFPGEVIDLPQSSPENGLSTAILFNKPIEGNITVYRSINNPNLIFDQTSSIIRVDPNNLALNESVKNFANKPSLETFNAMKIKMIDPQQIKDLKLYEESINDWLKAGTSYEEAVIRVHTAMLSGIDNPGSLSPYLSASTNIIEATSYLSKQHNGGILVLSIPKDRIIDFNKFFGAPQTEVAIKEIINPNEIVAFIPTKRPDFIPNNQTLADEPIKEAANYVNKLLAGKTITTQNLPLTGVAKFQEQAGSFWDENVINGPIGDFVFGKPIVENAGISNLEKIDIVPQKPINKVSELTATEIENEIRSRITIASNYVELGGPKAGSDGNIYDDLLEIVKRKIKNGDDPITAVTRTIYEYHPKNYSQINPDELAYKLDDPTAISSKLTCGVKLNCLELPILEKQLFTDLGIDSEVIVSTGGTKGLPDYTYRHGALKVGDQVIGYYAPYPLDVERFSRVAERMKWGNFEISDNLPKVEPVKPGFFEKLQERLYMFWSEEVSSLLPKIPKSVVEPKITKPVGDLGLEQARDRLALRYAKEISGGEDIPLNVAKILYNGEGYKWESQMGSLENSAVATTINTKDIYSIDSDNFPWNGDQGHMSIQEARELYKSGNFDPAKSNKDPIKGYQLTNGEVHIIAGRHRATAALLENQTEIPIELYKLKNQADISTVSNVIVTEPPTINPLALTWNAYVVRPANAVADFGINTWDGVKTWAKAEMAKTNQDAFKNIGQDITTTFENVKNGFELRSPIGTDGKLQLPFEQTVGPNADYTTKYSEIVPRPNATARDEEILKTYLQEDLSNPFTPEAYSKTVNNLIENTNGPLIEVGGPSLQGFRQIDLNTLEKPIIVTNIEKGLPVYHEYTGIFLGYTGKVDRILDATSMDLPNESVGAFIGAAINENVMPKFLEEGYRTLEPGGMIVLDTTTLERVLPKAKDLGFRVIEESRNPVGSINLTLQKPPFSMPEVSVAQTAAEAKPNLFGFEFNGFKNSDGNFTLWPLEKAKVPISEVPVAKTEIITPSPPLAGFAKIQEWFSTPVKPVSLENLEPKVVNVTGNIPPPTEITIPQKFTNWAKAEMAKTNPDAIKNIGQDITTAFDNFKNGFDEKIIKPIKDVWTNPSQTPTNSKVEDVISKLNKLMDRIYPESPNLPECRTGLCGWVSDDVEVAFKYNEFKTTQYQVADLNATRGMVSPSFKHAITVIEDNKGGKYLIDLTFSQFINKETIKNPIAAEIFEKGYIKLDDNTLNEYLNLMTSSNVSQPKANLDILEQTKARREVQKYTPEEIEKYYPELVNYETASPPLTGVAKFQEQVGSFWNEKVTNGSFPTGVGISPLKYVAGGIISAAFLDNYFDWGIGDKIVTTVQNLWSDLLSLAKPKTESIVSNSPIITPKPITKNDNLIEKLENKELVIDTPQEPNQSCGNPILPYLAVGLNGTTLPSTFIPPSLVNTSAISNIDSHNQYIQVNGDAVQPLENFGKYIESLGYTLEITSGYRSYEDQLNVHNDNPDGSAAAGESTHQTGLAVDLYIKGVDGKIKEMPDDMINMAVNFGISHPVSGDRPHFFVISPFIKDLNVDFNLVAKDTQDYVNMNNSIKELQTECKI